MAQNIRKAAVAGRFYAADPEELRQDVDNCYREARQLTGIKAEQGRTVQAVIVPHAGYVFSGTVAASAFAAIDTAARYDHIFIIGPSHYVAFGGASVDNASDAYQTPLGQVEVDTELGSRLIEANRVFSHKAAAHDREHCLEVELPFLQRRLDSVPPIIPIIIGTQDLRRLRKIAEALKPYFTPRNLFVISSDFSHYPKYDDAVNVDTRTGNAIATGSLDSFLDALEQNASLGIPNLATSACGQSAIAVLLLMAQDAGGRGMADGLEMKHLMYRNSGDSPYGGKDEVVGYHAFCLYTQASDEERPEAFTLTDEDKRQLLRTARNAISPAADSVEVTPTPVFQTHCGVFVTLNKHGRLRGCIGHFGEDYPLGQLTVHMARAAAFDDPRFPKVTTDELPDIDIEISVLTPLHRIHDISEFQYGKQGIYMRKGYRSGTFLPQVADEVDWTKEEFLGHCARDKAGIGWNGWRDAELYTYEAIIFSEGNEDRK